MTALPELQQQFAQAMRLAGDEAIAGYVSQTPPLPVERRLDIYRNNIAAALIRALEDLYPATQRLVGADFFGQTARRFVRENPPPHGVLMHYGGGFPEFLEQTHPGLEKVPYLPDVARLELAWHRSYIAAEAGPVDARALAGLEPEAMQDLRLSLHPSAQLLSSDYPVVRIWEIASADDEPDGPVDIGAGGEQALVIRPETRVEVRRLSAAAFAFLSALQDGQTLAEAAGRASQLDSAFDLQGHLATCLADGTFCDVTIPER